MMALGRFLAPRHAGAVFTAIVSAIFLSVCLAQEAQKPEEHLASKLAAPVSKLLASAAPTTLPTVIVLRPAPGCEVERKAAVDALRQAVVQCVQAQWPDAVASPEAEQILREMGVGSPPKAAQLQRFCSLYKPCRMVYALYQHHGPSRRVSISVRSVQGDCSPQLVTLDGADLPAVPQSLLGFSTRRDCQDTLFEGLQAIETDVRQAMAHASAEGFWVTFRAADPKSARPNIESQGVLALKCVFEVLHPTAAPQALAGALQDQALSPRRLASFQPAVPDHTAVLDIRYSMAGDQLVMAGELVTATGTQWKGKVVVDTLTFADVPDLPALNVRVLEFAEASVGKKIGNGECWTLAAEALNKAHARGANGYDFGRKLKKYEPALPGDIIQFTSARFEGSGWWRQLGYPNHTAVVKEVLGDTRCSILQQNPGPVNVATIDFADLKSGAFEFWRAEVPR